jgi:protein-tyrosine-phosphatase
VLLAEGEATHTGLVDDELVPDDVFTVLFVCTGNICRSAMAQQLGRAYLDAELGEEAERFRLVSAGTRAVVGSAMHPDSALVLRGLGGDPEGFTARQFEPGLAGEADLVLPMTGSHRRVILHAAPRMLNRTFLLREAAGLLSLLEPVRTADGDPVRRARALVKALAEARSRRPRGSDDEVPDPIAQPVEAHQEAADLIAEALIPLLSSIATAPAGREPRRRRPSST